MTTDYPIRISEQLERRLWAIGLFFHAPVEPRFNDAIELYFASPTYAACPSPRIDITDRELTSASDFYPTIPPRRKRYDVVFNMNWMPFKRHELFLDCLRYAKMRGRELKCLWFGYHHEESSRERETFFRSEVLRLRLDVTFESTIFEESVINDRYNSSSVSVICSTGEGGPRVFAESLLAGLPLVVTRDTQGGVPESLPSSCGIVCEPIAKSIAHAIWDAIDRAPEFQPREWACNNLSLEVSLPRLRRKVEEISKRSEVPINTREFRFHGYDWACSKEVVRRIECEFYKDST